jgi:hypothetical protein
MQSSKLFWVISSLLFLFVTVLLLTAIWYLAVSTQPQTKNGLPISEAASDRHSPTDLIKSVPVVIGEDAPAPAKKLGALLLDLNKQSPDLSPEIEEKIKQLDVELTNINKQLHPENTVDSAISDAHSVSPEDAEIQQRLQAIKRHLANH